MTKSGTQKGQTLIVMVFIMAIALAIGISVSNRFVATLRSSTRTYTGYRSQAVAEAALERILIRTQEELTDYINFGTCGSDCTLSIVNDDGITETATITLSFLGNSSDPYLLTLQTDQIAEVLLGGYSDSTDLTICWDGASLSPEPSVYGSLVYGQVGSYAVTNYAYNSATSSQTNGFDTASGGSGYDSCFTATSETDPQIFRLKSFYNNVKVAVIPDSSTIIPSQGILIESVGVVLDTTKKISVIRGNNIVPLTFDYAVFSTSETDPLSN